MVSVSTKNLKDVDVVVVKYTNCGCVEIDFKFKEFKIDTPLRKENVHLDIPNYSDINELKLKVICEYNNIILLLECGTLPDLEFLLEELSLIDIYENE